MKLRRTLVFLAAAVAFCAALIWGVVSTTNVSQGNAAWWDQWIGGNSEAELKLQNASAEERDQLRRKRERFEELSETEQARLRRFHDRLQQHPDRDELLVTMERYNAWLRHLTSAQRAEILDLPIEERVKWIKHQKDMEAQRTLESLSETRLPDEDIPFLYDWIDRFVNEKEDEIIARLPRRIQKKIEATTSPDSRRRKLAWCLTMMDINDIDDFVSVRDVESLLDTISEEARVILTTRESNEIRVELVREWVQLAVIVRNPREVDPEKLDKFFDERLTESQQQELDQMPPGQRHQRLVILYHRTALDDARKSNRWKGEDKKKDHDD